MSSNLLEPCPFLYAAASRRPEGLCIFGTAESITAEAHGTDFFAGVPDSLLKEPVDANAMSGAAIKML